MITRFEARNFKGIREVELNGLSRLNLFFVKNNVGKSSLLELLFILAGMLNLEMPLRTNRLRGSKQDVWEGVECLFYDLSSFFFPIIEMTGR